MSAVDGIVLGAFGMALLIVAGYFLFMAIRKTWTLAVSMEIALKSVPRAVDAIEGLNKRAEAFQQELQFMRAVAQGQVVPTPNFGVDEEIPSIIPRTQNQPVSYPTPIFERFTTKPPEPPADAEPSDTVVFDQTDEQMAEEETLENLIDQGLAFREEVRPPGREVNAE